jgi:hypothetical protein
VIRCVRNYLTSLDCLINLCPKEQVIATEYFISRNLPRMVASLVLFTVALDDSRAASFKLHFEVSGFPVSNGNPAPTDPVVGTIVWEATSIHDTIQSFDSINMTLDGHSYSVAEIGIPPPSYPIAPYALIGGNLNQPYTLFDQTDDFSILWNPSSLTPFDFTYTSSRMSGAWFVSINNAVNFTSFSITQIPESSTTSLLGLALLGAGARRYRTCHPETSDDSPWRPEEPRTREHAPRVLQAPRVVGRAASRGRLAVRSLLGVFESGIISTLRRSSGSPFH